MITHNLIQGSQEWHSYRAAHDNASDAPAMMGVSSYKTRDQLIAERATGIVPEVDAATQRLFDSGHRFEALARPLAEKIIGEELYPCTGSENETSRLSASFDGLTMLEDVAFEHKRLNKRLREALAVPDCTGADLPMEYQIQMEQQCAVSCCERVLFMASEWDDQDQLIEEMHCWYTPNLELRAQIVAGWEQFHKDVAAYVPPEAKPMKIVAEPVEALPAVFGKVSGDLAIIDNLPEFETAFRDFVEHRLVREPETDEDFAKLEKQVKAMEAAEAQFDATEEAALSQAEVLSKFIRLKKALRDMVCEQRKASKRQLTEKKESIKSAQVQRGKRELAEHIASLNAAMPAPYMPPVHADFDGAIKGKRTVDSLRGAVNDELARAKIAANEIADRIQVNLNTLRELASAHAFLFADTATIVLKQPDDLTILVKARIAGHQAAEQARLDAYRERIRAEEQATALRDAEAKARADAMAAAAAPAPVVAEPSPVVEQKQAQALIQQAQAAIEPVAAQSANVVPMHAAPAPAEHTGTPTLKLGQIAERLGFTLTADFLKGLGFEPAATDRASKLYHEADFALILAALVRHIEAVQARAAA